MDRNKYNIRPLGDSAIVIQLDNKINIDTHRKIIRLIKTIECKPFTGLVEMVPSYNSLTLFYNPIVIKQKYDKPNSTIFSIVRGLLMNYISSLSNKCNLEDKNIIEIPVVYGGEFGKDLEFVASYNNISEDDVVKIHSQVNYLVYLIGFTPGFPFLGGMKKEIVTPRKSVPAPNIPGGSIGIAGDQTGIYPLETPGGWQIIGRTPLNLFLPEKNPPTLLNIGDYVRFVPITKSEFNHIRRKQNGY